MNTSTPSGGISLCLPGKIFCHRLPVYLLSYKTQPHRLWVTYWKCKWHTRPVHMRLYWTHLYRPSAGRDGPLPSSSSSSITHSLTLGVFIWSTPVANKKSWYLMWSWMQCLYLMTNFHSSKLVLSLPPSPSGSLVVIVTSINTPANLLCPSRLSLSLSLSLSPISMIVTDDRWHVITARVDRQEEDVSQCVIFCLPQKHF